MYADTPICTFNSHLSQRLLIRKSGKTDRSQHLRTFAICKSTHSLKVSCELRHYMRIWLWVASSVEKCLDERESFKIPCQRTIVIRSLTPIDDSMKSMAELCSGPVWKNTGTQKHCFLRNTLHVHIFGQLVVLLLFPSSIFFILV